MYRTKVALFCFLFLLFFGASAQLVTIDWNLKTSFSQNGAIHESFKEALYLEQNNTLPLFNQWFEINGNQAEANFSNVVFEEFSNQGIDKSQLKKDIEFKTSIGVAQKQSSLMVSCIPLRVNEFSGKIEKLVSFNIQINSATSFQAKSLKSTKTSSVLRTGDWHKISIPTDGIYKIDYSFLQENGLVQQSISFSNFGVFGQAMGVLPEANSAYRTDDLEEIPLKIKDANNNNIWDAADYIIFYGKGPHVWHYDEVSAKWSHTINIYSDVSNYFVSLSQGSGLSVPSVNSLSGPNLNTSKYDFRALFEEEKNNLIYTQLASTMGSGREWYGDKLSSFNNTQTVNINVPNLITSTPAKINIRYAATSYGGSSSFTLKNNGSTLFSTTVGLTPGGDFPNAGNSALDSRSVSLSTTNNFEIVFNNNDPQANGFLDYIELIAPANLTLSNDFLLFRLTESIGLGNKTEFNLSNANSSTEVWDITQGTAVLKINGNLSGSQYQFVLATDSLREFVAVNVNSSNFTRPSFVGSINNQNLHGLPQTDMFIITPSSMLSAADRLADFHRDEGMSVAVIDIQKIYNEFSSGQQDLTAIRDFFKMFYDRATNYITLPKYALLLGDASFDYKDRIDGNENIIPTYESEESFSSISSYCTDDYIGFLDFTEGEDITNISNPNKIDIAIGRIPVDNLSEANGVADKIINYNTTTTMEDWRNVLTFVADDEDNNLHFGQVEQLTSLTTMENIDNYNIEKIYLDAYTQSNAAGGDRYPDVKDAILRRIRTGAFLINYTGHGGPKNWAQERVFNIEDIRDLENKNRLPLFITATCDYGPYDDTDFHSAGESLITNMNGGAVALITTTRLVFAFQNFDMNSRVLDFLFQEYQGRKPTVGEILMEAKNGAAASENNRKFVLLGDPAMTLAYPKHDVVTTTINGLPISQIDTLKALSKVVIEGEVRSQAGQLLSGFNGIVYPSVYDKKAVYQTKGQDLESVQANFELQNKVLFKGKASVIGGKFSFEFIVPKDINYAFDNGKVSYYAASNVGLTDAHGFSYDFIVGGTSDTILADDRGPTVEVFMNDSTFAFGGLTDENPLLLVKLSDASGINTVGNGVGHDIIGLLNENTQQQYMLNDYYSATLDDFTRGNIEFPFNKLENGRYAIRVKAWDVHNNPGEGYTEFIVASNAELALQNVFNYPNPFTTNTSFIFEHNRPGEFLDVSVQIFTVSGKLVKTIMTSVKSEGYRVNPNEITWNGLDDYGDAIGRGVYIYKVKVQAESGYSAQEFEKLVILR